MAFIGLRHPVVATVKTEPANAALTYNKGMVMGHAIQGNLTINRNDNPLYGDDIIVEDDNGITSMSIELGTDDLEEAVRVYALGLQAKSGSTTQWEQTDAAAPYVGFGYVRVRRLNGVTSYQGVWYHKVQFSEGSENSQTRGESIEWQTPTLTGRVMGVYNDDSGIAKFRDIGTFTTAKLAEAWLDGLAQLSAK